MLRGEINSATITENMSEPLLHIALFWPMTEKVIVLHKKTSSSIQKNSTTPTPFIPGFACGFLIKKIKQVKTTTTTACCMRESV